MTAMLLRYQRGTHVVPRAMLDDIPVTDRGDRSHRWSGIQHGELARHLTDRVTAAGLEIVDQTWSIGRGGAQLFGYLDLDPSELLLDAQSVRQLDQSQELDRWEHGFDGFALEVVALRMGVVHSNDSSLSLRLVVVPVVLVCSNGMSVTGGMIAVQKKHTIGLNLAQALDDGIRTYLLRAQRIDETISELRSVNLSQPTLADHLIVEAGRRGMFPWSKLGKVERYWRRPPHAEFEAGNGWSLMNAFTEVAKSFPMRTEMDAANRIRRLILDVASGE